MNPDIESIAADFDLDAGSFSKASNTILSFVYIGNGHVFRARTLEHDTIEKFEREQGLIDALRSLTPIQFPSLLPSRAGAPYVLRNERLWTAYPIIEGDILCNWWEMEKMSDKELLLMFKTLRGLHESSRGKLSHVPRSEGQSVVLRRWLASAEGSLAPSQMRLVERACDVVGDSERSLSDGERCFVHADYHPGNIIFRNGQIVGLVDTDWSRTGHYLEDVSYSVMTAMRDYRHTFHFDEAKFDVFLKWYDVPAGDRGLLSHYMVLAIFYDFFLFSTRREFTHRPHIISLQEAFLEDAVTRFA